MCVSVPSLFLMVWGCGRERESSSSSSAQSVRLREKITDISWEPHNPSFLLTEGLNSPCELRHDVRILCVERSLSGR